MARVRGTVAPVPTEELQRGINLGLSRYVFTALHLLFKKVSITMTRGGDGVANGELKRQSIFEINWPCSEDAQGNIFLCVQSSLKGNYPPCMHERVDNLT